MIDLKDAYKATAALQESLKRLATDAAVYSIDEMRAKLNDLSDAAGNIAQTIGENLSPEEDYIKEAE